MDIARDLVDSRMRGSRLARPSETLEKFGLDAAYGIAAEVDKALLDRGWQPVGRKLGFTNSATWDEFDLSTPIWAHVYNRTLIDAPDGVCDVVVSDLVAPRIEPEIVIGLNQKITGRRLGPSRLARAIDWIAPGFEIVDCHFTRWEFNAADIVADFGAHARLVVGPKVQLAGDDYDGLATTLQNVEVTLSDDSGPRDTGIGVNALGGPIAALAFLVETLATQSWARPLAGGELVTTGTLTKIPFVEAGEQWTAVFNGARLRGLTVRLN